ncbi:MAG TPA: Gfo/Idh/MocA family oxidoreductase [Pirellulaceae bacterium]|nr:Gfo/Idh/MocA family oxidoreductase [Pirellulaceae bacterium]
MSTQDTNASRRNFLKTSSLLVAGGAVASSLNIAQAAHAYGSDTIKIGLIGCGGRGTGAAAQAMNTEGSVKLVAMGDVFPNKVQEAYRGLKGQYGDKVEVPKEKMFDGLDNYKKVLESDCDLVILATPPGFRPLHMEAAVKAGKHVFMEKPVAVDAPGVRRVLAATEEAKKKDLAVAVGLQRRHERAYREIISELQNGKIGEINFTRAYWNGAGVWVRPRRAGQTELEYQINNWYYFNWLSGDHINEQHIHNLDVINWLKNGYPVKAQGQGGRQVRTGQEFGQIFDHHMVEFTYADGSKMLSQCRHIPNTWSPVAEFAHGSLGTSDIGGGKIFDLKGKMVWQTKAGRDGHQQEHHDLFADLRKGERPNEGEWGAKSTMTAIFGRMATYSGQEISWEDAIGSKVNLCDTDKLASFDSPAPIQPDANGYYSVPVPGVTTEI